MRTSWKKATTSESSKWHLESARPIPLATRRPQWEAKPHWRCELAACMDAGPGRRTCRGAVKCADGRRRRSPLPGVESSGAARATRAAAWSWGPARPRHQLPGRRCPPARAPRQVLHNLRCTVRGCNRRTRPSREIPACARNGGFSLSRNLVAGVMGATDTFLARDGQVIDQNGACQIMGM
jgi:hypothetical protein